MEAFLRWQLQGLGILIRATVKNEESRKRLRKVAREVFNALVAVWPEFLEEV